MVSTENVQCLIKSINFRFVDSGPCPEWDTNNDCCTDSKQCGIGRGHCDYDTECKWGLICGKENCPSVYNHTEYGCCLGNSIMWTGEKTQHKLWKSWGKCYLLYLTWPFCNNLPLEPDCTACYSSCNKKPGKCGENEGDCDYDSHCKAGLKCGSDNCPSGFPSYYDCCYKLSGILILFFFT